jgi:N utilization substance protein A
MASINLIDAFQEFKDAENIDRPTLMKVVEDVFKTLLRKKFGSDENFDVIVNAEKGDLEMIRRRMIVEDGEVMDPLAEIGYTDATKLEPDFEVGEELYEEMDIMDLVAVLFLLQSKHWQAVLGILKRMYL